jgi:hypothetical protein
MALVLVGSCAFINLMAIPAFEDEGSQLRWVWRLSESRDWLQSLGDGKPLEAWPMAPLLHLGVQPLLAIRAVHVLVGIIGTVLTYRLALRVTDRTTAFVSALLLAICPFLVYLQRFALSDVLLCASATWVLLSVLQLLEVPDLKHGSTTATALVLAAICKLPVGFVCMISLPLALLLMPAESRRVLLRPPALGRMLLALTPAAMLALAIVVVALVRVRLGHPPGFGLQDLVGVGMGSYTDIVGAIGVARPTLLDELTAQLTWPVVLLGVVGLGVSAVSGDWRQRWLLCTGLIPLLTIGLLARFWYSRYLLFTLPPLIVCATCGWRRLATSAGRWRLALSCVVLVLCAGLMGQQSARLIFNPIGARWSALDRFQYFGGWGSGYGYPEAANFIRSTPRAPSMIYALDGHSAYQLRNYLPAPWRSRVESVFYGPDGRELRSQPEKLRNLLSHTPAWIIIAEPLLQRYLDSSFGRMNSAQLELRPIAEFDKPGGRARLAIYVVTRRI